jgi:hypothetical protein
MLGMELVTLALAGMSGMVLHNVGLRIIKYQKAGDSYLE